MPPVAKLFEPIDISLPCLPAGLVGLRIAHLSDMHARASNRVLDRLIDRLGSSRLDMVLLTGDIQHRGADPEHAIALLERLCEHVHPPLGIFGVFGNHDSPAFRERSMGLPVHWLTDGVHSIADRGIEMMGFCGQADGTPADSVTLACRAAEAWGQTRPPNAPVGIADRPLRIFLCHYPEQLVQATELGADLVFCGHTHGGQVRLPWGQAVIACNDFPLGMASGLLRSRQTLCVISRGLGYSQVKLRVFCPPHAIMCTLRKGSMPGRPCDGIELIRSW